MCGIVGQLSFLGTAESPSVESLSHRGPDSEGSWTGEDGYCALGHTRLAIQDQSEAGFQPILSHCRRFVLVFNGEIYNHIQLRELLPLKDWSGNSDSETLVEGLAYMGPKFIKNLRGMFAFAFYNIVERKLVIARDRLGIKPLYLHQTDNCLNFSSELRSLSTNYSFSQRTISDFLDGAFANQIDAHLPYMNIHLCPAGHYLVDAFGSINTTQYWSSMSSNKSVNSPEVLPSYQSICKNFETLSRIQYVYIYYQMFLLQVFYLQE